MGWSKHREGDEGVGPVRRQVRAERRLKWRKGRVGETGREKEVGESQGPFWEEGGELRPRPGGFRAQEGEQAGDPAACHRAPGPILGWVVAAYWARFCQDSGWGQGWGSRPREAGQRQQLSAPILEATNILERDSDLPKVTQHRQNGAGCRHQARAFSATGSGGRRVGQGNPSVACPSHPRRNKDPSACCEAVIQALLCAGARPRHMAPFPPFPSLLPSLALVLMGGWAFPPPNFLLLSEPHTQGQDGPRNW